MIDSHTHTPSRCPLSLCPCFSGSCAEPLSFAVAADLSHPPLRHSDHYSNIEIVSDFNVPVRNLVNNLASFAF